jgi:AcrR family transcriptional regulator
MAALKLVEEHGLDALTMRRVAAELHVTPMSLYNHVVDRAELVDLMLDLVVGDLVAASATDEGDWEAKLRSIVRRNHEMWGSYPGFVQIYTQGVTMGPNGVANTERVLQILRQAGFSDAEAAEGFYLVWRYSVAAVLVAPAHTAVRGLSPGRNREERAMRYFSALPADQIPNIVATAGFLRGSDIEFGLDVIIAGLKDKLAGHMIHHSDNVIA